MKLQIILERKEIMLVPQAWDEVWNLGLP